MHDRRGGSGDHPDFLLLEYARDALESIGITLVINDPSDTNEIWNAKDANTTELWVQSWSLSLDPDPMQIWHSSNVPACLVPPAPTVQTWSMKRWTN